MESPMAGHSVCREILGVQKQLDSEVRSKLPLDGKGAIVLGRRNDNDDVLAVLSDGTYVNVHLVWGSGPGAFPEEYPSWFSMEH